jgi:Arc/MetJ-type ribon-helix-helix transcriptional regulator
MNNGSAIDRAFELARSGHYRSVSEVIRHLRPDDRPAVEAHLKQPNARRELILVCSEAWLANQ